jgi:hypothetical protein
MTVKNRRDVKDHQLQIRLSKNEYQLLEQLSVVEDRNLSDTLRVCFMREARIRLPSNVLKNAPVV